MSAANRNRGARAEVAVVNYLRGQGWPDAVDYSVSRHGASWWPVGGHARTLILDLATGRVTVVKGEA